MKKFQLFPVLIIVFGFLFTSNLWALKNVCRECRTMAALTDLICKKCRKPLNRCLACGTMNPVSVDYCVQCGEMLAEMRVLETIDPELREELRLGQSDRAQAERELAKITNQMEKEPEKLEIYLYRQAKIFRKMKFYSREAQAWKEYLEKFPKSPRKNRINAFYSEALRLWGYLFYEQGDVKTALEKFDAAVTANPMNAEAWMWVGRLKNEAKDIEGSAKAYLSALEARPGDKTAIHFLKKMKKTVPAGLLKPTAPRIPPGMEMALEATSTTPLASAPPTVVPISASGAISVPAGAPQMEVKKGQEDAKIKEKDPKTVPEASDTNVNVGPPHPDGTLPPAPSKAADGALVDNASSSAQIYPAKGDPSAVLEITPVPPGSAPIGGPEIGGKKSEPDSVASISVDASEAALVDSPARDSVEFPDKEKNFPSSNEREKSVDVNNPVGSGTPVDTASSALPAPDAMKNE